jgi:small subunit ribosomal protein S18
MIVAGRPKKRKGKEKKERRNLKARKRKPFLEKVEYIDYKDIRLLRRFMTDRGKITPRRISGATAKQQRMIAAAIKRARAIALVPFVKEYYR